MFDLSQWLSHKRTSDVSNVPPELNNGSPVPPNPVEESSTHETVSDPSQKSSPSTCDASTNKWSNPSVLKSNEDHENIPNNLLTLRHSSFLDTMYNKLSEFLELYSTQSSTSLTDSLGSFDSFLPKRSFSLDSRKLSFRHRSPEVTDTNTLPLKKSHKQRPLKLNNSGASQHKTKLSVAAPSKNNTLPTREAKTNLVHENSLRKETSKTTPINGRSGSKHQSFKEQCSRCSVTQDTTNHHESRFSLGKMFENFLAAQGYVRRSSSMLLSLDTARKKNDVSSSSHSSASSCCPSRSCYTSKKTPTSKKRKPHRRPQNNLWSNHLSQLRQHLFRSLVDYSKNFGSWESYYDLENQWNEIRQFCFLSQDTPLVPRAPTINLETAEEISKRLMDSSTFSVTLTEQALFSLLTYDADCMHCMENRPSSLVTFPLANGSEFVMPYFSHQIIAAKNQNEPPRSIIGNVVKPSPR